MTDWESMDDTERQTVLDVLEREAERLESEAEQMMVVSKRLGRPSLVDRRELKANAFRAAIDALRSLAPK